MAEHDWSRDWYCTRCGVALEETFAAPACAPASPGAGIARASRSAQGLLRAVALAALPGFAAGDGA